MPNTLYTVFLDGIGLHTLDPSVVITDVQEPAPQMEVQTAMLADRHGEYCSQQLRRSISVTVKLRIITADFTRRKSVWRSVNSWATHGRLLSISDRPGQQLRVRLSTPPAMPSALKWTDEISLTFTSVGLPYWQEAIPASITYTGEAGLVRLIPEGDAQSMLEVTAVNRGTDPLTRLRVHTGGYFITVEGMNIAPGESLSMVYDDDHILQLPLAFRTEDSSDDLPLTPGADNKITFAADQQVEITFSARGCFL